MDCVLNTGVNILKILSNNNTSSPLATSAIFFMISTPLILWFKTDIYTTLRLRFGSPGSWSVSTHVPTKSWCLWSDYCVMVPTRLNRDWIWIKHRSTFTIGILLLPCRSSLPIPDRLRPAVSCGSWSDYWVMVPTGILLWDFLNVSPVLHPSFLLRLGW